MKALTVRNKERQADERLLIEAAQKDPARFAELYENNFERVYAYVVRRVGDRAETEDLTSEVFHHALANLRRFEWRGIPFAAWLYRIAANLISDRWQRTNREQVADEPGTDRLRACQQRGVRRSGTAGNFVSAGRYVARGAAAGGGAAVCGTEKH